MEQEVRRRLVLFPRGALFVGPTHAVQVGSPLENVLALCRTAVSLSEMVDASILALDREAQEEFKVSLSKLF